MSQNDDIVRDNMCIAFQMESAEEAYRHIKEGYCVLIDYGPVAYGNRLYTWDSGERLLVKCKKCGKLLLIQSSEYHGIDDDSYYCDYFPVAGKEDADFLNRRYDGFAIERGYDHRYLQVTDGEARWSK